MAISSVYATYLRGVKAGLPFIVMIVPFALLFGVVATEAGLPVAQTMGFSVLVIAGAAQFTALQFMTENAPAMIILFSALAVNLRMAMYSAALTPHLGHAPLWQRAFVAYALVDQTFTLSINEYENNPRLSLQQKVAYFLGASTPVIPLWLAFTYVGAVVGAQIPPEYGLDFAVPIAFLAMVAPGLRSLAHIAAAVTSIVLALALASIPFNLGLLIAAFVAMVVGAEIERRMS